MVCLPHSIYTEVSNRLVYLVWFVPYIYSLFNYYLYSLLLLIVLCYYIVITIIIISIIVIRFFCIKS